jgi:CheY-like chemotaxis protein
MCKIMIVDDTAFMAKIAKMNLEKMGHQVQTVSNGQECLDSVGGEKPDVILLDAEMPVMDGWETCEALKASDATKNIPVIMCTGDNSDEYMEKAKQLGAKGYIVKPYNFDDMQEKIKIAVGE